MTAALRRMRTALTAALLLLVATPLPAEAAAHSIRIADARIVEGSSGYQYLVFTVRLANATGKPVTIGYRTVDGTARVGGRDYAPARGELTFHDRKVAKRVHVPVYGDRQFEATETFSVALTRISGRAKIKDGTGIGSIVNDDPGPQTVTVVAAGNGSGSVTSSPAGISCPGDCTESVPYGTSVTLSAAPAIGSDFTGWSGGGCSGTGSCVVTANQAVTVTATFSLQQHMLTVTRSGAGSGAVSSTPGGISCGVDCIETYVYGTMVTLTPTPDQASTFAGWSGACAGLGSCTVTMTQARTVDAAFDPA